MLKASILVAISGILYGFLGLIGSAILREHIDINTMLFWRFLLAGLWLSFSSYQKNHKKSSLDKPNKRVLFAMFCLGALGYAGSSGFYFMACQYMGTGLSMVTFYSYPVSVALFSVLFYKYVLDKTTMITLIAIICGLFLLRDASSNHIHILGMIYGILAAFSYAIYVLGGKQFSSQKIDSDQLSSMVCFGSAFVFLPLALLSSHSILPHSIKLWTYLIIFAVLITAIPIQLMLEGLKSISSMRASIISVLEPIVTLMVGVGLLHESITFTQALGATIILISALLVQFQKDL